MKKYVVNIVAFSAIMALYFLMKYWQIDYTIRLIICGLLSGFVGYRHEISNLTIFKKTMI